MQSKQVKVGIIQMSCVADKATNIEKTILKIREIAQQGAQIICLQELFTSLYFCETEDHAHFALAEAIPSGDTTQTLQKLAQELGVVIIASLFEKRAQGLYHNTTAVIDADGTYLGKYRKQHIPDDPGFYEKFYFTPGDHGYKVFATQYGKLGVLICWDQWYPEAARITALLGAEILFYPTAIGWELDTSEQTNQEQYNAWQTIQRSHAIANGVPVVSVNRVGQEGITQFWGGSFICNAMGTVVYQASHHQEAMHIQTIDLGESDHYRTVWPFLRDRRIDTYQPILQRYLDE
ncbi:MAG: carbon-nitrogen hydrolase [Microscillaceae bacterium]|jgi:N-carbamoylputrescine amidase|nr:carbon-nitrogen hydrolase [Microscillaceae bacterium]